MKIDRFRQAPKGRCSARAPWLPALLLALGCALAGGAAQAADPVPYNPLLPYTASDPGLKLRADSTAMIEFPISARWALQSSMRLPTAMAREGLKVGLQGNYGINLGDAHRLSMSAGLGLTDAQQQTTGPDTSLFRTPAVGASPTLGQRKDFLLDFHWDWELTEVLSLNSSIGLSHAVGTTALDAPAYGNQPPPATSAGFVGLKLRF
ncbi:hypothetical protein BH09PSE6_BH09PSE6_11210 [soil metagenome]